MRTLIFVLALLFIHDIFAQEVIILDKIGARYSRSLSSGQEYKFQLHLGEGEIAFVSIKQNGVDIIATTMSPDQVFENFDTDNGANGLEIVSIVGRLEGNYEINVKPLESKTKAGNFVLTLTDKKYVGTSSQDIMMALLENWNSLKILPGFGVAVLSKDKIYFEGGFGFSDISTKKPYTIQTIQNIGSVSKTFIGMSLMQLVSENKISLDSYINDFLPFKVLNPRHTSTPITIEHLATHTSSIAEMPAYEKSYILTEPFNWKKGEIRQGEYQSMKRYSKNKSHSMGGFLNSLLNQQGKLYSKKSFSKQKPGSTFQYSNAGATLAAHLVENIIETSYDSYVLEKILKPLGMDQSGWSFADIDMQQHATLYFVDRKAVPRYRLITYPDGGLLTSVSDLTKFLQEIIKGHQGTGELLSAELYAEMLRPRLDSNKMGGLTKNKNQGIFWEHFGEEIGHNGGDPGAVTLMRFNPESGIGRILMCNMLPNASLPRKAIQMIWRYLGDYSTALYEERTAQ